MMGAPSKEQVKRWEALDDIAEREAKIIDIKRKCCPKWGKAGSYDDCEECPAYNACMEDTIKSDKGGL